MKKNPKGKPTSPGPVTSVEFSLNIGYNGPSLYNDHSNPGGVYGGDYNGYIPRDAQRDGSYGGSQSYGANAAANAAATAAANANTNANANSGGRSPAGYYNNADYAQANAAANAIASNAGNVYPQRQPYTGGQGSSHYNGMDQEITVKPHLIHAMGPRPRPEVIVHPLPPYQPIPSRPQPPPYNDGSVIPVVVVDGPPPYGRPMPRPRPHYRPKPKYEPLQIIVIEGTESQGQGEPLRVSITSRRAMQLGLVGCTQPKNEGAWESPVSFLRLHGPRR